MSADLEVHALLGQQGADLSLLLRATFVHPWVASYQIGFGPPLLRATPSLTESARASNSAIEKLEVYLAFLLSEDRERKRLSDRVRLIALNRAGRLDAELWDRANNEALDLSLRLYHPSDAPPTVKREMLEAGVSAVPELGEAGLEALTARICLRLADPQNRGLVAWVGAKPEMWALEFWVPTSASAFFGELLARVAEAAGRRSARAGSVAERWARIAI